MPYYSMPNPQIGGALNSLTPDQRAQVMLQMLAGGGQGLGQLPQNATAGQMLLGLGTGLAGGMGSGMGQVRQQAQQERAFGLQERALQERLRAAQQKAAERAQLDQIVAGMPVEQQNLYRLFGEGSRDLIHPKPPDPSDRYRVVGGNLLDISGDAPTVAYRAPQDPAKVTPYSDIAKLQADLQRGFISQEQYDRAQAAMGEGGKRTALQSDAAWYAQVKDIPVSEAADFMLLSAQARTNPDKVQQDIFKIMLNQTGKYGDPDPQTAWERTSEALALLEGGIETLPAQPQQKTTRGVWAAIKHMMGLGGDEPVQAAPQQAAPSGQPRRPVTATPLPPNPSALRAGQAYQLPDGRIARFDGQGFEVIE